MCAGRDEQFGERFPFDVLFRCGGFGGREGRAAGGPEFEVFAVVVEVVGAGWDDYSVDFGAGAGASSWRDAWSAVAGLRRLFRKQNQEI